LTDNTPFFFLKKLLDTNIFDQSEAITLFEALIDGKLDETQSGVFLTALAFCPDNPMFLANAAAQVLKRGQKLPSFPHKDALDTCGTGGDYSSSFNISTTVAFILAACGVPVIKHGNRSSSSNSGSSDVLQYLGVRIDLPSEIAEETFKKLGICFCFAPQYYPFLKNLAPIRKKLGFRTIFNQIGPLVNPGGAGTHLLGVSRNSFLDLFAKSLLQMGKQGIVVCGGGKMDEVILNAPNELRIIRSGVITASTLLPADFGLNPVSLSEIKANSIE
jgi:anthranilate phosphoribosyltransferase